MKIKTALQGLIAGVALLVAAGTADAQERQLFQALLRAEGNTMQEYLATIVREKIRSAPEALKDLVRGSERSNGT